MEKNSTEAKTSFTKGLMAGFDLGSSVQREVVVLVVGDKPPSRHKMPWGLRLFCLVTMGYLIYSLAQLGKPF